MGKRSGPCLHCGITYDLHWRQGPCDKPVLCNSCGIRYKICGNLENYNPRHCPQRHNNNLQAEKDEEEVEKDEDEEEVEKDEEEEEPPTNDQESESDNATAAEKRSEIENLTPIEKFQKELLDEWTRLGKPSSSSPDDVLIFQNVNNFIPSNEVGLGAVLLKPEVKPELNPELKPEGACDRPESNADLNQPEKILKRRRSKRRMTTTAKLLGNFKIEE